MEFEISYFHVYGKVALERRSVVDPSDLEFQVKANSMEPNRSLSWFHGIPVGLVKLLRNIYIF